MAKVLFNGDLKKESIEKLEKSISIYEETAIIVQDKSEKLFRIRQSSGKKVIKPVEKYINSLANTPKEFSQSFSSYKAEFKIFSDLIESINKEALHADIKAGGSAAAGVAAGVGTAALMPAAAMAIASTFGTASTGTAIAALSGAAATNASLAWLGGGALVAGGSGMAGGSALLALAGPIGLGIGAVGIVGGSLLVASKNKDIAEKANKQRRKVEVAIKTLKVSVLEIDELIKLTNEHHEGINRMLLTLSRTALADYTYFSDNEKKMLASLVNHIESLSKLINKKIN